MRSGRVQGWSTLLRARPKAERTFLSGGRSPHAVGLPPVSSPDTVPVASVRLLPPGSERPVFPSSPSSSSAHRRPPTPSLDSSRLNPLRAEFRQHRQTAFLSYSPSPLQPHFAQFWCTRACMSDSEDALNDLNRPSAVGGRSTTDKRRRTARACDSQSPCLQPLPLPFLPLPAPSVLTVTSFYLSDCRRRKVCLRCFPHPTLPCFSTDIAHPKDQMRRSYSVFGLQGRRHGVRLSRVGEEADPGESLAKPASRRADSLHPPVLTSAQGVSPPFPRVSRPKPVDRYPWYSSSLKSYMEAVETRLSRAEAVLRQVRSSSLNALLRRALLPAPFLPASAK